MHKCECYICFISYSDEILLCANAKSEWFKGYFHKTSFVIQMLGNVTKANNLKQLTKKQQLLCR